MTNGIPAELLQILACPETKQPLAEGSQELLREINDKIKAGELKNRAGEPISEGVEGLLVREDRRYGYVIREGIPVLLEAEAVELSDERD